MILHRLSTVAVLIFGLLLFILIIPSQVETVSYGWLQPNTVPNALAIMLIILAGVQLFTRPSPEDDVPALLQFARASGFFVGVGVCAYLMPVFGFLWVAMFMALCMMFAVGERRPVWLVFGGVLLPALVWYCAEILLDRPLP